MSAAPYQAPGRRGGRKVTRLRGVKLAEVSTVDDGDNPPARISFWKRLEDLAKQKTKRENGIDFPRAAFAYTPDPETPSTWKLRLWENLTDHATPAQVGRAVAALGPGGFRGNRVQIPSEDLPGVKRRVRAAFRRVNPGREIPNAIKGRGLVLELVGKVRVRTARAQGHAHGLDLPDGTIGEGTYRTNGGGRANHVHELAVPNDLAPGESARLTTGPPLDGADDHTHDVTVRAREREGGSMTRRSRLEAIREKISKLFEAGSEPPVWEEIEAVLKQEGAPRLFDDVFLAVDPMDVMRAVDMRQAALMESLFEIARSDLEASQKEAAMVRSVEQFAEKTASDVPALFAGELTKELLGLTDPTRDQVEDLVAKKLAGSGSRTKKGDPMKLDLSKIPEEYREHIENLTKSHEALEAIADDLDLQEGADVVEAVGGLKKSRDELQEKVTAAEAGDDPVKKALAALPENVRKLVDPMFEAAKKENETLATQVAELTRKSKREELTKRAQKVEALGNREAIVDLFEKASEHGFDEDLEKVLTAAAKLAERGLAEIGSGLGDDVDEALAAEIEKERESVRANPTFKDATDAAVSAEVWKRRPDLAARYRGEATVQ